MFQLKCAIVSSAKDAISVSMQMEFQLVFPTLIYEDLRFSHTHYRSLAVLKCKQ